MDFSISTIKRFQAAISALPMILVLLFSLSFTLAACQSIKMGTKTTKWVYADLRIVSTDFSENPSHDMVAAYTRESSSDIQIRLDFLDISPINKSDIYIALDTKPGGTNNLPLETKSKIFWDTLITIPTDGRPGTYLPLMQGTQFSRIKLRTDVVPRVTYDPLNDYVIISLNKFIFPENNQLFQAQVFLTAEGSTQPVDIIGPFQFDDKPQYRAPVLIAFWNVFPAYTPAQAIRRWDGAHTGPYGEQHGLNLLLQAVRNNEIPITLLDLRTPTSISALDYIGQLPTIQKLVEDRLIALPDTMPGKMVNNGSYSSREMDFIGIESLYFNSEWALDCARIEARLVSQHFNLPLSKFLYAPQLPQFPPNGYRTIFTLSSEETRPHRWFETNLIPLLHEEHTLQATTQGLSLVIRKELLKLTQNRNNNISNFIFLGGSLPESTWGDPEAANATMRYIAEHPWIKPLYPDDLMAMRFNSRESSFPYTIPINKTSSPTFDQDMFNLICTDAENLLKHPIVNAAWQSYLSLFSPLPPEPALLQNLRANYFHQIDNLVKAAQWADQPFTLADCSFETNQDGQTECVLASENYYAVFDRSGARLKFLFIRLSDEKDVSSEVHQLIGPTSQFLVGLGDPSTWNLEAGDASESGGVHGAFSDTSYSWDIYSLTEVSPGHITFTSPDGILTKSYKFDENRLSVEYRNTPPITVKIPLALDPWTRFTPDWGIRYWENQTTNGWVWGLHDGPQVKISSNGTVELHPFTASQDNLIFRENPNFEYPPGHFIPFPIALSEIQSISETLTIQLDYR